jgi:tRNA nucleotidyltransferase (CCA-adding enzyme)
MDSLSDGLKDEVDRILRNAGFKAEVSIQGSVAKDTWLHKEGDLDVFASLPSDLDRGEWESRLLPSLRRGLSKYALLERYAEHPYLEFEAGGVKVNVVPCYSVEMGKWKSATDRTPFHTRYMQQHLTDDLKREVRILKKFMKGVGVYGAEIRVGGFSGMLVETLTLRYGSFTKTIAGSSTWGKSPVVELESSGRAEGQLRGKFKSPIVVVDPIDPDRNLAAAVRADKLWEFVEIGRQFQDTPSRLYFYPRRPLTKTRGQLLKRVKERSCDFVVVLFPHNHVILDILWGQLFSLERSLIGLTERYGFRVLRSSVWGEAEKTSAIMLAVESARLSGSQLHLGPPVERKEESRAFLDRHLRSPTTISGPWIQEGRWMVEKRRHFTELSKLIVAAAQDTTLDLAVPAQLEEGFRKRVRILQNEQALSNLDLPGFAQALWNFMVGKPAWMRITDS